MARRTSKSIRSLTGTALGLLILSGCASDPKWPDVAFERSTWTTADGLSGIQILTDHFDLRVTARDIVLQDYLAPFLETTYREYARLVPQAQYDKERLVVYLFDNRPQWANFTRANFPARARTYLHILSGGFVDHETATAVVFDIRRDKTLSLLAHEGMHQYFARHLPLPVIPWLNEGLACQWEAFDLQGPYPIFTPRKNLLRRNNLREALTVENGWIHLRQLLRMDAGQAIPGHGGLLDRMDSMLFTFPVVYYFVVWVVP